MLAHSTAFQKIESRQNLKNPESTKYGKLSIDMLQPNLRETSKQAVD